MTTTKPRHNPALDVYDVIAIKLQIRDKLVSKGLQLNDANAIVERASIMFDPSTARNARVVEAFLNEYSLTIGRLRKYTLENGLPEAVFINMASGVEISTSNR